MLTDDSTNETQMAERCFGFGSWEAQYWFIGPEQGKGPNEPESNARRVEAWIQLGRQELNDCFEFHQLIGENRWHGDKPLLERTWRPLILLLMTFLNRPADNDSLRRYQKDMWGRTHGETCVIDLSGIAAKSSRVAVDRERFKEKRVKLIIDKMRTHRPKLVVLYGAGERQSWARIAGSDLSDVDTFVKSDHGLIAFAPHPISRGRLNEDWIKLGRRLRSATGS